MKTFSTVLILIVCLLAGCSHTTANMSKYGHFVLAGGMVNGHVVGDNLVFNRVSLYQEFNLLLEIMSIRLTGIAGFQGWLSEEEKKRVQSCAQPILLLVYTLDEVRLRQSLVTSQVHALGFEIFGLTTFRENLSMHPDYAESSLKMYKAYAYCGPQTILSPLVLSIPGFEPVEIRL